MDISGDPVSIVESQAVQVKYPRAIRSFKVSGGEYVLVLTLETDHLATPADATALVNWIKANRPEILRGVASLICQVPDASEFPPQSEVFYTQIHTLRPVAVRFTTITTTTTYGPGENEGWMNTLVFSS